MFMASRNRKGFFRLLNRTLQELSKRPDIEFYESRYELGKRRRLVDQVRSSDEVWGWWHTGGGEAALSDVMKCKQLKKIIVADPTKSSIDFLWRATGETKAKVESEIIEITKKAVNEKIAIKWFPGLTACTLLIGNPLSRNGWVQVETMVPHVPIKNLPSFRIEQSKHPDLFEKLVSAYNEVWDKKSSWPPETEKDSSDY